MCLCVCGSPRGSRHPDMMSSQHCSLGSSAIQGVPGTSKVAPDAEFNKVNANIIENEGSLLESDPWCHICHILKTKGWDTQLSTTSRKISKNGAIRLAVKNPVIPLEINYLS